MHDECCWKISQSSKKPFTFFSSIRCCCIVDSASIKITRTDDDVSRASERGKRFEWANRKQLAVRTGIREMRKRRIKNFHCQHESKKRRMIKVIVIAAVLALLKLFMRAHFDFLLIFCIHNIVSEQKKSLFNLIRLVLDYYANENYVINEWKYCT